MPMEPAESYIYALPYEWHENYHVRRYGFHGTSHRFVSERAAQILGIAKDQFNGITCHMGATVRPYGGEGRQIVRYQHGYDPARRHCHGDALW